MKIPVREAITSGDWLECSSIMYQKEFFFRLRTISFEKILTSAIDKRTEGKLDDGILWLMRIEVININKKPLNAYDITCGVVLLDQDDCIFHALDGLSSMYGGLSMSIGLLRFETSSNPPLQPKIKAVGAIAFLLPDDDQAEYFFSVK